MGDCRPFFAGVAMALAVAASAAAQDAGSGVVLEVAMVHSGSVVEIGRTKLQVRRDVFIFHSPRGVRVDEVRILYCEQLQQQLGKSGCDLRALRDGDLDVVDITPFLADIGRADHRCPNWHMADFSYRGHAETDEAVQHVSRRRVIRLGSQYRDRIRAQHNPADWGVRIVYSLN